MNAEKYYRVGYLVHEFMTVGVVRRDVYAKEFYVEDKTLVRDIKTANEILEDFYGYTIIKTDPKTFERIDYDVDSRGRKNYKGISKRWRY